MKYIQQKNKIKELELHREVLRSINVILLDFDKMASNIIANQKQEIKTYKIIIILLTISLWLITINYSWIL